MTSLVLAHTPTTATAARPHALRVNLSNSQVVELVQRAEGGGQGARNLVDAKYPVEEKGGCES